jgi:hypothetical protein
LVIILELFGIPLYLLFVLLIFGRYYLDVSLFEKIQDYEEKTLGSSKREANQVTLDHIDPMCFLSRSHIVLHSLILLPKPYTFRIWIYTWFVLLSHAVLSVMQVFHLYDVEYGLCLSERDAVSHPSRCDSTM